MNLDKTTLIEIQDYINALDERVGLKPETVEDVRNAIDKHKAELKNLRLGAVNFSLWEYGTCNEMYARRHKLKKNVQFVLWEAGEQGHKEDYWHNFDRSLWEGFAPTN